MNCKPGDLAVVVRCDFPENIGKLVEVLRLAESHFDYPVPTGGDVDWEVVARSPIRAWDDDFRSSICPAGETLAYADCELRPLRDKPGADETLDWAGKPADIKTPDSIAA